VRPDEFVKKIAQNVAQTILFNVNAVRPDEFVKKIAQNVAQPFCQY
jgi:hypothetical protein